MKSYVKIACLAAVVAGALGLQALPAFADGPVAVKLDLFDGDKYSHAFSEGLRAAVANDARYAVSDNLPGDGIKLIMKDSISYDSSNDSDIASYAVDIKLASGKFVATTSGYCDVRKFDMCGRVVAEDAYNAYTAYIARTAKN